MCTEKCAFAHGPSELREQTLTKLYVFYRRQVTVQSVGSGSECKPFRKLPCRTFIMLGACPYKENCSNHRRERTSKRCVRMGLRWLGSSSSRTMLPGYQYTIGRIYRIHFGSQKCMYVYYSKQAAYMMFRIPFQITMLSARVDTNGIRHTEQEYLLPECYNERTAEHERGTYSALFPSCPLKKQCNQKLCIVILINGLFEPFVDVLLHTKQTTR
jgi:hypothetical protein